MIHRSGIVEGKRIFEDPLKKLPCNATDLRYTISSNGCWLPGVYDTEKAAKYAFRLTDKLLYDVTRNGITTFEMLKKAKNKIKEIKNEI